jgi:glutamate/tyrosine decarboxylase-like PLP-dependent enzyme
VNRGNEGEGTRPQARRRFSIRPDRAALAESLAAVVQHLLDMSGGTAGERVLQVADTGALARLRRIGIPATGRALDEVVREMLQTIYPYRARMDHPRFFGFIPGLASPLSWIGDLLTAGHNAHAGSWMQSSGPSCIESELIGWLCARVGLPQSAGGLFVSGGSMANLTALTVARDRILGDRDRELGVAYVSEQTHSSVAKGLKIIGFLDRQIRKVAVDAAFRMDAACLAKSIAQDRAAGLKPFAVVASAGTTNTGSIDPLPAIAGLCTAERLWLHVDGAYGASVVLSPSHRGLLSGIEHADSLSWDAHKWLFQTYGCGVVLLRDQRHLPETFHTRPEYLRDALTEDDAMNFWDFGPELTRPARSLKLWLTLQVLGSDAIGEAIGHGFRLAEWAQDELRGRPDWRIVSPAQMAILNFRFEPPGFSEEALDAMNSGISRRTLAEGFAGVLTTRLSGRTVLRICAIHPDATEADMRETIRRLDAHAQAERAEHRA